MSKCEDCPDKKTGKCEPCVPHGVGRLESCICCDDVKKMLDTLRKMNVSERVKTIVVLDDK